MRDIDQEQLLAELRALRPAFQRQGVTAMALFGSRARRDNRIDSDVDLLIEIDETRKFSLLDLIGVGHTIEDNVGMDAHIVMRRTLDPRFERNVLEDEVEVF